MTTNAMQLRTHTILPRRRIENGSRRRALTHPDTDEELCHEPQAPMYRNGPEQDDALSIPRTRDSKDGDENCNYESDSDCPTWFLSDDVDSQDLGMRR